MFQHSKSKNVAPDNNNSNKNNMNNKKKKSKDTNKEEEEGELFLSEYKTKVKIGKGQFGKVYKCIDSKGLVYAVKEVENLSQTHNTHASSTATVTNKNNNGIGIGMGIGVGMPCTTLREIGLLHEMNHVNIVR